MAMEDRPSVAAGPEQAGKPGTLVVCCVELDAAQLQPAFDVLAMRGFEIAVIERHDAGSAALAEHAQRHGLEALFVLARVVDAPESVVVPLEAALRTANVAADHISALAIDWRDPMALVEHVAALAGTSRTSDAPILRTTTASPPAGRRESTGPQRTIALVSPRTETGPQRPVPPAGKQTTGPYATVPPPPVVKPKETTAGRRTLGVKVVVPQESASTPTPAAAVAPAAAVEPATVEPVAVIEAAPAVIEASPAVFEATSAAIRPLLSPPPALVDEPDADELPEARPSRWHTVTAALRPLAQMTGSGSRSAWSWVASSRTRLAAVSATAIVAAVAIAIMLAQGGGDTNDAPSAAPVVATAAGPAKPSTLAADAIDPATNAANASSSLVAQALARKQLRVHEGIVFAPLHAPKRKFQAARKQCDDMNAGALKGWRMPMLAELHVLAVARVIDRGVYWSGTEETAFGTHALIWSEKKSAAIPITKAWTGARALCVRDESSPR